MVIYARAEHKSYNLGPITIFNQICSHFMHNAGQWGTEAIIWLHRGFSGKAGFNRLPLLNALQPGQLKHCNPASFKSTHTSGCHLIEFAVSHLKMSCLSTEKKQQHFFHWINAFYNLCVEHADLSRQSNQTFLSDGFTLPLDCIRWSSRNISNEKIQMIGWLLGTN